MITNSKRFGSDLYYYFYSLDNLFWLLFNPLFMSGWTIYTENKKGSSAFYIIFYSYSIGR